MLRRSCCWESAARFIHFRELSSADAHVRGLAGPLGPGVMAVCCERSACECHRSFLGENGRVPSDIVPPHADGADAADCGYALRLHPRAVPADIPLSEEVTSAKTIALCTGGRHHLHLRIVADRDLLEFYAVDPAKTRVIHHGLTPLPRCQEAARKLRAQLRRDFVLYVGSRAPYKNFDELLKAFHETGLHDSFDLLVLGGGPLTEEEMQLASKSRRERQRHQYSKSFRPVAGGSLCRRETVRVSVLVGGLRISPA